MIKEFIIAAFSIILVAIGAMTGDSVMVFLAVCLSIVIGMYSAYYYKGEKNYWYPIGVIGTFILFMVSSQTIGGYPCTLLLFLYFGIVLYFSWYAQKGEVKPVVSGGRFCSSCGSPIGESAFCPACGAKQ